MSLSASRSNLLASYKKLRERWDRAKEFWDDPVSRNMEERFLDPLEPEVRNAAQAMSHLNELIHAARRDCEP